MGDAQLSGLETGASPRVVNTGLVRPAWIVIGVGWLIMLLPLPGTGLVGILIAGWCGVILAIVNMVRGAVAQGVVQFLAAVLGTALVYLISWVIFVQMLAAG